MKAYIPENLYLGAERHSDKYYYLITLLYYRRIFDKTIHDDSFIPVNGKVLSKILGGRYKQYLRNLLNMKIIETNNHYVPGEISKGYRLRKKYRNIKHREIQINDKRLIDKIIRTQKQLRKDKNIGHLDYLEDCLHEVQICYDEAIDYIDRNITDERYFYHRIAVDMINGGAWNFTIDDTAGRIHTNITTLCRELRQFLRFKNETLVEVDIANSQPFIFNILIKEYLELYYTNKSILELPHYLSYGNQSNTTCLINTHSDIELYKELTTRGSFYEYIMEKLCITESRSEFKVRFFSRVFYSRENPNYVYWERKQFQELFPNVAKIITHYKTPDYCNLAILLQKKEADIMIRGVSKKLSEMNIYFLTIHDSILTTRDNVNLVREIIKNEFMEKYSLEPMIRIK